MRRGDLSDMEGLQGTTSLHERSESKLSILTTRSVNNFLKNEVIMKEWDKESGEWTAFTLILRSGLLFGLERVLPTTENNTNLWMSFLNVAPLRILFI